MLNLVKTISTEIDSLKRRIVKVLRLGQNDVQTSLEAGSFGVDSNPTPDLIAIYAPTEEKGKTVIIGYINRNQIADVGEHRIFSTNAAGDVVMFLHLKNDGIAEFGGNADFMVRFNKLETAFNEHQDSTNDMINEWNTFASAYVPGSPLVTGLPPTVSTVSNASADISGAKIDEIKTL